MWCGVVKCSVKISSVYISYLHVYMDLHLANNNVLCIGYDKSCGTELVKENYHERFIEFMMSGELSLQQR